jgi:uncharacterized membrane protein YraQ (UPF0718 family)
MDPFRALADWLIYSILNFDPANAWGQSLHFFVEDVTKIFVLLVIMVYLLGFLRANLDTQKVKSFLQGKNRFLGYLLAALFGAVTPFCSCSSIPLFLAFTQAGIPLGMTMAFLFTSPLINEVAVVQLGGLLGLDFTLVYIATGLVVGIAGGLIFDLLGAQRFLTPLAQSAQGVQVKTQIEKPKLNLRGRHDFALTELRTILKRIWLWILVGVGVGALIHGWLPSEWITEHLGADQLWSVPGAVALGIPLYSNATGTIPIAEALLSKGLPVGTTLALMMSTVGASLPELVMLKKVMQTRLLALFVGFLLVFFTLAGWFYNFIFSS